MDKRLAGLLGGVAALVTLNSALAAVSAAPGQTGFLKASPTRTFSNQFRMQYRY